jgi:hypothetical protein
LYSSPVLSNHDGRERCEAQMGKINAYKILVGKSERKKSLARPKRRCDENITVNLV